MDSDAIGRCAEHHPVKRPKQFVVSQASVKAVGSVAHGSRRGRFCRKRWKGKTLIGMLETERKMVAAVVGVWLKCSEV